MKLQIDVDVLKNDDDSTTSSSDDDSDDDDTNENENGGPTVEMTVALGDFDSHPIIPMIENNDTTNKEEIHQEDEITATEMEQTTKTESLFLVKNKTKPTKKILIEELS